MRRILSSSRAVQFPSWRGIVRVSVPVLLLSCGQHKTQAEITSSPPDATILQPVAQDLPLTEERPLTLWKVSRDGLEPSWLFGTCHAGVVLDEALPEDRESLLRDASVFVMELDMSSVNPAAVRNMLMLPDDQTLETILGKSEWRELVEELELGIMAGAFKRLHPFAIYAYVTQQMANESGSASIPMDLVLSGMAQGANVEAAYLETLEEQMDLFLKMDMDMWIEHIGELGDPDKSAEMEVALNKTLDLCRTGDPSGFSELAAELEGADQEFNDRLFRVRNENWIEPLEGHFERGSAFVAVGAGHLFGESSVPSLLEARGWTVEQQSGVTVDRHSDRELSSTEDKATESEGEAPAESEAPVEEP